MQVNAVNQHNAFHAIGKPAERLVGVTLRPPRD
jgi:hypothetical protein